RYCVIVQLPDFKTVHDIFGHNAGIITVDLGRRKVNEFELEPLLQPQDILESDYICHPQIFIKMLPIPTPELRSEVVDVIKVMFEEDAFDLSVMTDIAFVIVGGREQASIGHD